MKVTNQWLAKPLYEVLPFVFLVGAIALLQLSDNILVTVFAVYVFCYGGYIYMLRLVARDSVLIG